MRCTTRLFSLLLVVAGSGLIAIVPDALSQTTPQATQEIQALLDFVERSECQFVRNGLEYPASRARAHLQQKLEYLEGKNRVSTAEDFIDLAATESSLSGRAYEVRCQESLEPASTWLKRELQRQRQLH
ncbi:DUF5329 domain-containing protein [Pseudomonas fluorescens]|uniref:DUF5329 domain-containing protein n=1 Tax=Pseudomonas fluorescens TaxID=294 RepID=A0A5E6PYZ2_PSEFL|nr:DUF5329 domain-containing protein [Pseudomonas fluorescens]VVM48137.1 hypothetical protein PS655_00631 [Pseudomonas fluorescens]